MLTLPYVLLLQTPVFHPVLLRIVLLNESSFANGGDLKVVWLV